MEVEKRAYPILRPIHGLFRRTFQVGLFILGISAVLFLSSGDPGWRSAWLFLSLFLGVVSVTAVVLIYANPNLVATRANVSKDAKSWDHILAGLVALTAWGITALIAGLDHRFGWTTEFSPIFQFAAIALAIPAQALKVWAMVSNPFFTTLVTIQKNREHKVCEKGPYRYIRHPGHMGMLLFMVLTPIILESFWAVISSVVAACLLLIRVAWEDGTLSSELRGYSEYATRVPYRLVPGIW
jgi:protein-S-isoprenylcysteine O-methyltransferase Ste14